MSLLTILFVIKYSSVLVEVAFLSHLAYIVSISSCLMSTVCYYNYLTLASFFFNRTLLFFVKKLLQNVLVHLIMLALLVSAFCSFIMLSLSAFSSVVMYAFSRLCYLSAHDIFL